jgi:hypothetical protein
MTMAQLGKEQVHHDFKYIPDFQRMGEKVEEPMTKSGKEKRSVLTIVVTASVAAAAIYLTSRAALQRN